MEMDFMDTLSRHCGHRRRRPRPWRTLTGPDAADSGRQRGRRGMSSVEADFSVRGSGLAASVAGGT